MSINVKSREAAEKVLRDIQESNETNFLPIIGPTKGKYLADTVKEINARRVLEIGTLVGYSAIMMALNMPPDGKIITIEINSASAKKAEYTINRAELAGKIQVINENAINVIPGLGGKFDMIFIDAAKDEYMEYLRLAENKLKPHGVVFADNVKMFAASMSDYLEYVRKSGKYSSRTIDVGFDAVEISTRLG